MHRFSAHVLTALRRTGPLVVILSLMLGFVFQPQSPAAAQAGATFNVNTTNDTLDANPGDGQCRDAWGNCSLRAAVMEANALYGPDSIRVPPGIYTLTRPNTSPDGEHEARTGDLDVTADLEIHGTSGDPTDTIIQAGPTPENGIDKVLSVNPNYHDEIDFTITGLTIRHGRNVGSNAYEGGWRHSSAHGYGGAMDWDAGTGSGEPVLTIDNCRFIDNTSLYGEGGGLSLWNAYGGDGRVIITNTLVQGNHAPSGAGGGMFLDPFLDVTIRDSTIEGNTASHDYSVDGVGGGIFQAGVFDDYDTEAFGHPWPTRIYRSTISNNHVSGDHADGGGVFFGVGGEIYDSTISGNTSTGTGGGVSIRAVELSGVTSTSALVNVTITGNHADSDDSGGELGGGLWTDAEDPDEVTLVNSLITGNFTGSGTTSIDNAAGPLSSASSHNLTSGPALYLGPLADNGGPTLTHALLTGSPALDAGSNSLTHSSVDQRGFPRIADSDDPGTTATVDIGAYEGQINAALPPDLTIQKSHSGSVFQGQTGLQYTLSVRNTGSSPTSGTVTVIDTLPDGLTATAMTGDGWHCTLATRTCTRADALAGGASYPPITLTVNVDGGASSPQVNTAAVSGGGDSEPSNNSAADSTVIIPAPVISTQPTAVTVCEGAQASFSAAAGQQSTLQWQTGPSAAGPWTNMSGRTSSPLTFTTTTAMHETYYRAVFTNPAGTTTSNAALLTVNTLPVVTTHPANAAGYYGEAVSFSSAASGRPAPSLQWQSAPSASGPWSSISGAASSPYTVQLNPAVHPGTSYIRARWSNTCGSANSNSALLEAQTFVPPDMTLSMSGPSSIFHNQTGLEFTITARNSGGQPTSAPVTISYTLPSGLTASGLSGSGWSCNPAARYCTRDTVLAAGISYPAITLTVSVSAAATSPLTITAVVSGGGETVTNNNSASASPTVYSAPSVSTHPSSRTVCEGAQASFSAAGGPQASIQWQSGPSSTGPWSNMSGRTTSPLILTTTAAMHGTYYRAAFSNPGGTAYSNAALLTVNTLPVVTTHPQSRQANYGSTVSFSSAASGRPTPTVRWQVAPASSGPWTNISGAASPTYTLPNLDPYVTPEDTYYRAVWSNTCGSAASDAAHLEIGDFTDPDMTVTKTHTGDFYQNQTGAVYTITVRNSGGWVSAGTVTVTDNLPAGLTASAMTGSGWNCDLAARTCTRSDALADGDSYPPITLTVNVSPSAPASLTNTAVVSGGNEINETNNTASDPTTIHASPAVTLHPTPQTVCEGTTAVFTAAGGPNAAVQWQAAPDSTGPWANMSGQTAETLSFTTTGAMHDSYYRTAFSSPGGTAYSNAAKLIVNTAPVVTIHPLNQSAAYGAAVSFTSAASGRPSPAVLWQSAVDPAGTWLPIPGASLPATTVTLDPKIHEESFYVRAVWSNTCGQAVSEPALLDLITTQYLYLPVIRKP